jgi:hypothetical protein
MMKDELDFLYTYVGMNLLSEHCEFHFWDAMNRYSFQLSGYVDEYGYAMNHDEVRDLLAMYLNMSV